LGKLKRGLRNRRTNLHHRHLGENAAYKGDAIPVPSSFDEAIQRKANHFDTLVAVLRDAARPMGLSGADFELWLPRAQAALAKAEAIREGLPDPDGVVSSQPIDEPGNIERPRAVHSS